MLAAPVGRPRPGARASAAPSGAAGAKATVESALRLDDPQAAERGTALHALLEQVGWLEDFDPARHPLDLEQVVAAVLPRRPAAWIHCRVDEFRAMLRQPAVREALSRGAAPPESRRLWREMSFARLVDGELVNGRIDRLVGIVEGGRVVRATVIDYKTDDVEPLFVQSTAERYRPQLLQYRDAAAERLGLPPRSVATHLLFVTPGELVELD